MSNGVNDINNILYQLYINDHVGGHNDDTVKKQKGNAFRKE